MIEFSPEEMADWQRLEQSKHGPPLTLEDYWGSWGTPFGPEFTQLPALRGSGVDRWGRPSGQRPEPATFWDQSQPRGNGVHQLYDRYMALPSEPVGPDAEGRIRSQTPESLDAYNGFMQGASHPFALPDDWT